MSFVVLFNGFTQLVNVTVDAIPIPTQVAATSPALSSGGFINYRIYANAENPSDAIDRVQGSEGCVLDISTTTNFFISGPMATADPIASNIVTFFFGFIPELRYSSVVTIGTGASGQLGVQDINDTDGSLSPFFGETDGLLGGIGDLTAVTLLALEGEEWWPTFSPSGGNIIIDSPSGGGWFTTGGANAFGVGVNNSVLLGSFTTDGDFSYNIGVGTQEAVGSIDYTSCTADIDNLIYPLIGCSNETACNYDSFVDISDPEQCVFALGCSECDGEGGVIDNLEVGEPCDDGDDFTDNDVIQEDCTCAGELSPAADACIDAILITIDGGLVSGDNTGTTDENFGNEPACFGNDSEGDGDVWFSFVGDGS